MAQTEADIAAADEVPVQASDASPTNTRESSAYQRELAETAALAEGWSATMENLGAQLAQTPDNSGPAGHQRALDPASRSGDAIEAAISQMLSEVSAQIADLQEIMRNTGDTLPGVAESIADLQQVQSELSGLLTALQNGMMTKDAALSSVRSIATSVQNVGDSARRDAHVESTEMKAEVFQLASFDSFEAYNEAKNRFLSNKIAESSFDESVEGLLDRNPGYAEVIDEAITLIFEEVVQNPELAADQIIVGSLTPEGHSQVEEIIENEFERFMERLDALEASKREYILRLIAAEGGMEGFRDRFTRDHIRILDAAESGENPLDESVIQEHRDDHIAALKRTFDSLPEEHQQALLDAFKAYRKDNDSLSFGEFLLQVRAQGDEPSDLFPENATKTFNAKRSALDVASQIASYVRELGLKPELIAELEKMSDPEKIQKFIRLRGLEEAYAFYNASELEKADMLVEAGVIDAAERDRAIHYLTIASYGMENASPTERDRAMQATMTLMNSMQGGIDNLQLHDYQSFNKGHSLIERVHARRAQIDFFNNSALLNPEGVDFNAHPELFARFTSLLENREGMAPEAWLAARHELSEEMHATVQAQQNMSHAERNATVIAMVEQEVRATFPREEMKALGFEEDYEEFEEDYEEFIAEQMYKTLMSTALPQERTLEGHAGPSCSIFSRFDLTPEQARTIISERLGVDQFNPGLSSLEMIARTDIQLGRNVNILHALQAQDSPEGRESLILQRRNELALQEFRRDPTRFREVEANDGSEEALLLEAAQDGLEAELQAQYLQEEMEPEEAEARAQEEALRRITEQRRSVRLMVQAGRITDVEAATAAVLEAYEGTTLQAQIQAIWKEEYEFVGIDFEKFLRDDYMREVARLNEEPQEKAAVVTVEGGGLVQPAPENATALRSPANDNHVQRARAEELMRQGVDPQMAEALAKAEGEGISGEGVTHSPEAETGTAEQAASETQIEREELSEEEASEDKSPGMTPEEVQEAEARGV